MSGSTLRTPRPCSRSPRSGLPADPEVDASRVTSAVVPIYSGDKQRANHRSELAIPAARSIGGLRYRGRSRPQANWRGEHRSLIRREGSSSPTRSVIPFFPKVTKRSPLIKRSQRRTRSGRSCAWQGANGALWTPTDVTALLSPLLSRLGSGDSSMSEQNLCLGMGGVGCLQPMDCR